MSSKIGRRRGLVLSLAVIVVFVVTYTLILPSVALDQKSAEKMPGIDVKAVGTSVQEQDAEADSANGAGAADALDSASETDQQEENAEATDEAESEEGDSPAAEDSENPDEESAEEAGDGTDADLLTEKTTLTYDGEGFEAEAECDVDTKLPSSAQLQVKTIKEDTQDENGELYPYQAYCDKALETVRAMDGEAAADSEDAMDGDDAAESGRKVELYEVGFVAEGEAAKAEAPVKLTLKYDEPLQMDEGRVLAVALTNEDGGIKAEVLDTEVKTEEEGVGEVAFEAAGADMYAVVYPEKTEEAEEAEEAEAPAEEKKEAQNVEKPKAKVAKKKAAAAKAAAVETGNLKVFKEWKKRNGDTTPPDGVSSVVINLQRYVLDEDGEKVYDDTFNRAHRDLELTVGGSVPKSSGSGYEPWSYLFENLQISGAVGSVEGDYHYEVVEDTVTGYVAGYHGNDVVLEAGDSNAKEVTVRNVEHYDSHTQKTLDASLFKMWNDPDGQNDFSDAEATFRLYRYVHTESWTEDPTEEKTTVTLRIGETEITSEQPVGGQIKILAAFNPNEAPQGAAFTTSEGDSFTITGEDSFKALLCESEPIEVTENLVITCTDYSHLKDGESGGNIVNANYTSTEATRDTEFNSAENDAQYTQTLTGNYQFYTWENLVSEETFESDGHFTKYVYGYYMQETGLDAGDGMTYLPVYVSGSSLGTESNRIYSEDATVMVMNEGGSVLKIQKEWYRLIEDHMPPVVIELSYKQRQNDQYRVVTENAIQKYAQNGGDPNSSSATETDGWAEPFASVTDKSRFVYFQEYTKEDGSTCYGVVLSAETGWTLNLVGLPEDIDYRIREIGYLDDGVVKQFPTGDRGFDNRHYYFSADGTPPEQTDHAGIFNYVKDNDNTTGRRNTGTMYVYNIPKYIGYQPELKKHWYGFNGRDGMSYLGNGYDSEGLGFKVQPQQRATWAITEDGHQAGDLVHDWEDYMDELTIHNKTHEGGESYENIDDHAGGDSWLTTFSEYNFSRYGYEQNPSSGKYELVVYDYQFKETGMALGSDGRTWSKYSQGYAGGGHRYNMMNFETGPLEIKKEWNLADEANKASKIYFTVKSDNNERTPDVAKRIFEEQSYEYYGLKESNVAYVKELGEYCIVMSADDDWDLIIQSLDLLNVDVDEEGHVNIGGEVTYKVEEAAIEKDGEIIAITDNAFPYTASYYSSVRGGPEQLRGNTSENTATNRLVADGLQLDSTSTWDGTTKIKDNQPTYVKVVNSDQPTTSYTVTKTWPNGDSPTDTTPVVLTIQQRLQKINAAGEPLFEADGKTPQWATDWQGAEGAVNPSVTLPLEGVSGLRAWTYTWKGLPTRKEVSGSGTADARYQPIYYRVIETSSPDWSDPRLKTIENGSVVPGTEADQESYIGQTAVTAEGETKEHLEQELSNEPGEMGLEIEKEWKRDGETLSKWPEGYSIDYRVVRHTYLTTGTVDPETGAVTYARGEELADDLQDPYTHNGQPLTGKLTEAEQSKAVSGLPKGGLYKADGETYSVEYEYEVVETAMTLGGKTYITRTTAPAVSDAENPDQATAKLVNNLTSIKVLKVWDDEFDHSGDSVQVQLYSASQRPAGPVPMEYLNLTVVADTWFYQDTDQERAEAPEDGSITVTITAAGASEPTKTVTLTGPDYTWTADGTDLPKYDENDQPIVYTVAVASGSDALGGEVKAASVNGNGLVSEDGAVVHLTGEVEKPADSFLLTFHNIAWQIRDQWQDGAQAPTGDGAYIEATLTGGGVNKTYRLDSSNNWGADISESLLVNDEGGNPITYSVSMQPTGSQIYAVNDVRPTSFSGTPGGTTTVEWRGIAQNSGSGGNTTTARFNSSYNNWGLDWNNPVTVGQSYSFTIQTDVNPANVTVTATGTSAFSYSVINNWGSGGQISVSFTPASTSEEVVISTSASRSLRMGRMSLKALLGAPAAVTKTVTDLIVSTDDEGRDKTPADRTAVGSPITLNKDNVPTAWAYEWTDLPTVDENGDPLYYYVRETSVDVDSATQDVYVSYGYNLRNPENAREGIEQVIVTNRTTKEEPAETEITIRKKDENGALLDGAKFLLEKQNGSAWEPVGTEFTATGGSHKVENLTEGTYRITETQAPPRYVGASGPAIFTVTKSGTSFVVTVTSGSADFHAKTELDENFLDVDNTPKVTDFEFTKIWKDLAEQETTWMRDIQITLYSTAGGRTKVSDFTLSATGGTTGSYVWTATPSADGKRTTFRIENLPATDASGADISYYIVETQVPGYLAPVYAFEQSSGAVTPKPETDPTVGYASDGQYVINTPEAGVELPHTGGPGTRLLTGLGAAVLLLSACALFAVRRRMRRV